MATVFVGWAKRRPVHPEPVEGAHAGVVQDSSTIVHHHRAAQSRRQAPAGAPLWRSLLRVDSLAVLACGFANTNGLREGFLVARM